MRVYWEHTSRFGFRVEGLWWRVQGVGFGGERSGIRDRGWKEEWLRLYREHTARVHFPRRGIHILRFQFHMKRLLNPNFLVMKFITRNFKEKLVKNMLCGKLHYQKV